MTIGLLKEPPYENAHAGLPLVQHALSLMLYYNRLGLISLEKIAEKMSHALATCFNIKDRGFIREGYYADLVVADLNKQNIVNEDNILYKCGWSPLLDFKFPATICNTFVNGNMVYGNGLVNESVMGQRLIFTR